MLQLIVVAFLLWFNESGAVQLSEANNGWIIDEDTQPSIKCTGFNANDTVTWSILPSSDTPSSIVIGSCAPSQTTCNSSDPNIELSRPSQFYSNLTIHSGHRELMGKSVECSLGTTTAATTATSRIRVIRRGVITDCETTEDYSKSWTLPVNCTIEGAFSSDNRYTCTWHLSYMGTRINSTTTPFIERPEVPGQQYISGHCVFTWQLPTADGDYTYQLQFYPGPLLPHTVKHVTIRTPAQTTSPHTAPNCPEFVAENDTLICDCITTDPGSPPSEVQWSGFSSHQLTIHNVTRNLNGTVYTCTQIWGVRQFGNVSYTLRVTVSDPPSQPVITGYNTSHVLTAGDSVSLTCTVSGGNPPITSITFYCGKNSLKTYVGIFDPMSSSNTVEIDRVNASDNGSGCVCTGKWHPDSKRHFERAVRLKVAAAEVPRVEVLTLNGNNKSLTVSVGDNSPVILRCGANGRPKPSIRVVRVDTGQPLEVDTSHTSGQDENVQQYTLTTSARCQDAAIYRCHASNREGTDEKNITLFVNCTGKDVASQFPLAVVAGGAGAAVVLLIITVIVVIVVKRRKGIKSESTETERNHIPVNSDDEFEEHINIVYESSDDVVLTTQPQTNASKPPTTPLRVHPLTKPTDKNEQETSFGYVTLNGKIPTENCPAPRKSDRRVLISQYTDVADAYSTVDDDGLTFFAASSGWKYIPQSTTGLSSDYADVDTYSRVDDGRGDFLAGQARSQTDMASDYADVDGYSSVKESGPRMETSPQKASRTQDDYAVVNNAGKAAKGSAQPDDYAQVNKTPKPGNPSTAPESEKGPKPIPDVYARVQKSTPGHETDGTRPGPADNDEYNCLNFGDHQPTSENIDEQYSHIGAPS